MRAAAASRRIVFLVLFLIFLEGIFGVDARETLDLVGKDNLVVFGAHRTHAARTAAFDQSEAHDRIGAFATVHVIDGDPAGGGHDLQDLIGHGVSV